MSRESEDIWWNSWKVQHDKDSAPVVTIVRLFNPTSRLIEIDSFFRKICKFKVFQWTYFTFFRKCNLKIRYIPNSQYWRWHLSSSDNITIQSWIISAVRSLGAGEVLSRFFQTDTCNEMLIRRWYRQHNAYVRQVIETSD